MRLSKALEGFLDDCRNRKKAAGTVAAYEGDCRHLVALAMVTTEDSLRGFTEELVTAYVAAGVKKGNGISTLKTKLVSVGEFARYCLRKRYLALDPMVNAPEYRLPHRLPRPFSSREVERLMALTETEQEFERREGSRRVMAWRRVPLPPAEAMLRAVLYHSALRVGTAVDLRLEHIHQGRGGDLGHLRVITKGNREIEVPLVPELERLLIDYMVEHTDGVPKSFLLSRRHGQPWTVRMAQRAVHGWGRAAGVPKATPHRFRHTAAGEMLDTGATLEETQEFLGHASISSTQIYRRAKSKAVSSAALRRAQLMRPAP